MHAVIKTGGQQFKVAAGDRLKISKRTEPVDQQVSFDEVLMISNGTGDVKIGAPLVKGANVLATVVRHGRGDKVIIQKFRRRKHYDKIQGHRQDFTEVEIKEIIGA
jgi:large subunit ribosomal protein L21